MKLGPYKYVGLEVSLSLLVAKVLNGLGIKDLALTLILHLLSDTFNQSKAGSYAVSAQS